MAQQQPRHAFGARSTAAVDTQIDEGLRQYMLSVYNYMMLGLGLTAAMSFAISTQPALVQAIFGTPLRWVAMLAPLGMVIYLSARLHKMSFGAAQISFWVYAALMGISLAYIPLVYPAATIFKVFLVTGITFGATSLYGYTTKRDISSWGGFLIMGVIGMIVAGLVNIFLQSSALHFAISAIGVLVFTGLTAYDTQRIKEVYRETAGREALGKAAIMGALALYLDFINLFLSMLSLFGGGDD